MGLGTRRGRCDHDFVIARGVTGAGVTARSNSAGLWHGHGLERANRLPWRASRMDDSSPAPAAASAAGMAGRQFSKAGGLAKGYYLAVREARGRLPAS